MEIFIFLIEIRNSFHSLNLPSLKSTFGWVVGVFLLFPSPIKKKSTFCLTWHNSGGYFQLNVFLQGKANVSWKNTYHQL